MTSPHATAAPDQATGSRSSALLALPSWYGQLGEHRGRAFLLALLAAAVAIWLLPRAYTGVRHDGMLYLAQALMQRWPETYRHDIFFAFGSQDQFSIFSPLYAAAADLLGWSVVGPALLLTCQVLLAIALLLWLGRLVPVPFAALGLVLIGASPFYGGYAMFSVGEGFFTARSIAEPLVILALLAWHLERRGGALVLLAMAATLHPLVAVPALAVVFVLASAQQPRWLWLLVMLPLALLASGLGVPGFDRLIARFDPQWWGTLAPNAAVFPQQWRLFDWSKLVFDAIVLFACGRLAAPRVAALARAVLLVAVAGILIAVVAGELLQLVLWTQVQLWRAQWLAHVLACGLFPWLVWRLRDHGPYAWISLALLFTGISFRVQEAALYSTALGGAGLALALIKAPGVTRAFTLFGAAGVLFVIGAGVVNDVALAQYLGLMRGDESDLGFFQRLFEFPTTALLIVFGVVTAAIRQPRSVAAVALLGLIASLSAWDQRSDWMRYLEGNLTQPHPLARHIPPAAQVYWPGDLQAPWFLLKRPSYYTSAQASGLIFNRQTALEWQRRDGLVNVLEVNAEFCRKLGGLLESCTPGREVLEELCAQPGTTDFIVLTSKLDDLLRDSWSTTLPDGSRREYHLYACAEVRERTGPGGRS